MTAGTGRVQETDSYSLDPNEEDAITDASHNFNLDSFNANIKPDDIHSNNDKDDDSNADDDYENDEKKSFNKKLSHKISSKLTDSFGARNLNVNASDATN